jgi:hypothetical protein
MARTERLQLSGCAPGVCGAAAAVVLTGRGAGAPDDSTVKNGAAQPLRQEQPPQRTGSAPAPPGSTGRVDTALTDLEGDGSFVASAFRQLATEFLGIERPPPHQHPFR